LFLPPSEDILKRDPLFCHSDYSPWRFLIRLRLFFPFVPERGGSYPCSSPPLFLFHRGNGCYIYAGPLTHGPLNKSLMASPRDWTLPNQSPLPNFPPPNTVQSSFSPPSLCPIGLGESALPGRYTPANIFSECFSLSLPCSRDRMVILRTSPWPLRDPRSRGTRSNFGF